MDESHRLRNSEALRKAGVGLGLIVALGGLVVSIFLAAPDVDDQFARLWPLLFAGFPIMGALVLWRKPGNRIGLIMLWIGIAAGIPQAINSVAVATTDPRLSAILERIGNSFLIDWILIIALLAVFPSGSTSSRTMKWLLRILFVLTPLIIGLVIVSDVPLPASGRDNPLAVPALSAVSKVAIDGFVIVPLSALAALVSVIRRWRKAAGTDRLQYRWFAVGIALFVVGVTAPNWPVFDPVVNVLAIILGVNAVPASIAIAVLRYRLYEIDRLISRSVTYTIVIGLLAGLYAAVVYIVQGLLGTESQLAVAGSTLTVAAAFTPVRRRVQALVDRRFNRARFDADREVAAFGDRLQGAVDLSSVTSDLGSVIANTVKPASAAIWIRD